MTQKKRILIIDDERGIATMMKFNLESLGHYEVFTETNSENALNVARELRPNLILLDLVMPGVVGIELFRELEKDPVLKNAPVVFLSGMMTEDEALSDPNIRNHPYLEKPVDVEQLLKCVQRYAA